MTDQDDGEPAEGVSKRYDEFPIRFTGPADEHVIEGIRPPLPGSFHLWEKIPGLPGDRLCSRCKRVRPKFDDPEGECPGEAP